MICRHCGLEFPRKVERKIHEFIAHRPKKRQYSFYFWNLNDDTKSRISK